MIAIAVGFPLAETNTHHISYGSNFLYQTSIEAPPESLGMLTNEPKVNIGKPDYSEVNTEENVPFIPQWRCPLDKQCVRFVEKKLGRELNRDAYLIYPNTYKPCLNCGVLLYSSNPFGHIAFIQKIESESFDVIEQNWESCGTISTRSIEINSWKIRGYIK